jgi:adenylate cyclase
MRRIGRFLGIGHHGTGDILRQITPWLVLLLALVGKLADPLPVAQLQRAAFDYLERLSPRAAEATPVSLIAIDDESLTRFGQWPWPRRTMARLLDRLAVAGTKMAVLDILFAEPDRTSPARVLAEAGETVPADLIRTLPDYDEDLAAAMRRLPTVLAFALVDDAVGTPPRPLYSISIGGPDPKSALPAFQGVVTPIPVLAEAAAGIGMLNALTDPDGTSRRLPLLSTAFGRIYPSLVLEAARVLVGDKAYVLKSAGGSGEARFGQASGMVALRVGSGAMAVTVPTDSAGALVLHLAAGPAASIIPAWKILDGSLPPSELADRVVLIGATAKGLTDPQPTALGPRSPLELHAEALEQILLGAFIARPDWALGLELVMTLLLGAALILALSRLGPVGGAVCGVVMVGGLAAASFIAFTRFAWQLDAVYPALTLIATYASATILAFVRSDRERTFIRDAFGRFLSPDLVDRLAADPRRLQLSGERREMSFMFTDIAGFTSLSEQLGPVALAPILNAYLDGACGIIMAHGGLVNEFIGDAILAFFGAPLDQPDHARRALDAARELDLYAERFRRDQTEQGVPFGATRIGIHSGTALVGNFGSSQRFKYTALGDVINTASRIEGLNKFFGTRACASGATAAAGAGGEGDPGQEVDPTGLRPIGRIVVSGKTEALAIFEVLPTDAIDETLIRRYRAAYRALEGVDAAEALSQFEALAAEFPDDGPTAFHLQRLRDGESGALIVMNEK